MHLLLMRKAFFPLYAALKENSKRYDERNALLRRLLDVAALCARPEAAKSGRNCLEFSDENAAEFQSAPLNEPLDSFDLLIRIIKSSFRYKKFSDHCNQR